MTLITREKAAAHRFENHVMSRSNAILQHLQSDDVDACQSGNSSKVIPEAPGRHWIPANYIPYMWRNSETVVNLPRSHRPAKLTPRAKYKKTLSKSKRTLFQHPGVCSLFLSLAFVSIRESIKKKVEKNEIHGKVPRQKPLLTGKLKLAKRNPGWSLRVKTFWQITKSLLFTAERQMVQLYWDVYS